MDKKATVNGVEFETTNECDDTEFISTIDRIKGLERLTAHFEDGSSLDLVVLDDVLEILND